jgi:hypothetical protein
LYRLLTIINTFNHRNINMLRHLLAVSNSVLINQYKRSQFRQNLIFNRGISDILIKIFPIFNHHTIKSINLIQSIIQHLPQYLMNPKLMRCRPYDGLILIYIKYIRVCNPLPTVPALQLKGSPLEPIF